jgi:hypothetical protein
MTQEVMGPVAAYDTPQEVWSLLEQTYSSQSRARTVDTRIALATTRKDDMSISEYIIKMKSLADEMASAKKNVDDEELVSYILAGLDEEYNPVVFALLARVEPVSVVEAHSTSHLQKQDESYAWRSPSFGQCSVSWTWWPWSS